MAKKRNELYYQMPYVETTSLERLSDSELGQILRALNRRRYSRDRERLESVGADIIYQRFCDHIDEEHDSYDEAIEKKRKAINTRWNKEKQCNTPNNDELQSNTKTEPNINRTETETEQNRNRTETKTEPNQTAANAAISSSEQREAVIRGYMNNSRWMQDTSQLVMMPIKMMRDEMEKFILQLRVTEDTNYEDIQARIVSWLRKGKRIDLIEKNKNNECRTNNTGGTDARSDGRNAATDFIDEFCRKAGI